MKKLKKAGKTWQQRKGQGGVLDHGGLKGHFKDLGFDS
jgi:hypothetical protein